MAASVVQICNLALARIGARKIDDLGEDSAEAQACTLFYAASRDAALQALPWTFATGTADLARQETDRPDWRFRFSLPADFLIARRIIGDSSGGAGEYGAGLWYDLHPMALDPWIPGDIPFEVAVTSLYADRDNVCLVYTGRQSDPNRFDPLFVEALSYKLAMELVMPLTLEPGIYDRMARGYEVTMGQAGAANANQSPNVARRNASWHGAR